MLKNEEIYNIFDTTKLLNSPPRVIISKNSGAAGLAVWLSHHTGRPVEKSDPDVAALKRWVDAQYASGRVTNIGGAELAEVYEGLKGGREDEHR